MRLVRSQFPQSIGMTKVAGALFALFAIFSFLPAASAVADDCPNAELRAGPSAALPDCRAYERLSPLEKQAHNVLQFANGNPVAEGGAVYNLTSGSEDSEGFMTFSTYGNVFASLRQPGGWLASSSVIPATIGSFTNGAGVAQVDYTPDLSRAAMCASEAPSAGSSSTYGVVCGVRSVDGTWKASPVYPYLNGVLPGLPVVLLGSSDDLSSVFFRLSSVTRLVSQDTSTTGTGIYQISGLGTDDPQLHFVSVDDNGAAIGNGNPNLDGYQAISDDGKTVFFSASTGGLSSLYARVDNADTVTISSPECTSCVAPAATANFFGASADGKRAFFSTTASLVAADTDTTADVYMYDFDGDPGHHLTQVSAGDASNVSVGNGAQVQGQGVITGSSDGTHVYFTARGVLTTKPNAAGQSAAAGLNNVYLYQRDAAHPAGLTQFVGSLPAADSVLWTKGDNRQHAQTPEDGRYLVFETTAALDPADTDGKIDIYRYDSVTQANVRVSKGEADYPASGDGNGAFAASLATLSYLGSGLTGSFASVNGSARAVSSDGSYVLFSTPEALQANDTNEFADYYVWHDGEIAMVSSGKDTVAAINGTALSPSGRDVYFTSYSQLVPEDTDTLGDLYTARIDGGIPYVAPTFCDPLVDGSCDGTPSGPPAAPDPGSSAQRGDGNLDAGERSAISGLRKISSSDRSKLAKGRKARLTLKVNRSGTVTVAGTARVGKKNRRVVSSSAKARKAGSVTVPFALSRSARSELRSRGRLTVSLVVRFTDARPKVVKFTLRAASSRKGGRS